MRHIPGLITALACAAAACTSDNEERVTAFSVLPPSSKEIRPPADLPPDTFTGEFWVDREGCTFIRTATGGWVPRMNADRTQMCDPGLVSPVPDAVRAAIAAPEAAPAQSTPEVQEARISIDPDTGSVSQVRPELVIPTTYVQVGSFSDVNAGLAVREKFINLGFPVVGKELTPPVDRPLAVVLGPYRDSGFLEDALDTAKSLGHNNAYIFQN